MSARSEHRLRQALPSARTVLENLSDGLIRQWDELLRLRLAVLQRFVGEDIHDLRVASRRLRSVTDQLAPFVGSDQVARMRRPIRKLTRELGQLRNLDETRDYLLDLKDAGLGPLTLQLEQQRRKEARRVRLLLHELPIKRLERQFRAAAAAIVMPEQVASQGVFALLSARNLELYRPIHALLQISDLPDQAEERHALRIAIKKWRYFSELLATLLGHNQGKLLGQLKEYQSLLGELNDREVIRETVRSAPELAVATHERVDALISSQHQQLVQRFKKLLEQRPLQYQFMV